jgi:hypothetical protein
MLLISYMSMTLQRSDAALPRSVALCRIGALHGETGSARDGAGLIGNIIIDDDTASPDDSHVNHILQQSGRAPVPDDALWASGNVQLTVNSNSARLGFRLDFEQLFVEALLRRV